jgi:hypothetical protein
MAISLIAGFPETQAIEGTVTAGTAIAEGDLLEYNGNVLQRATSSSTIHTLAGVSLETISTTDTEIKFAPLLPGQLFEVDVANNTASTQRYESMILTDHDTINNTDTTVTGPTGVFKCLALTGAASDKKLIGTFHVSPQTST